MHFFYNGCWLQSCLANDSQPPSSPAPNNTFKLKTPSEYLSYFANICNDNRWIYFLNGLMDGTNIYFSSCCNLAISYANAYHHLDNILDPQAFQLAGEEFHSALNNPEIFTDTLLFGLGFVSFAALGSFYDADDENNKNFILRQMAFCWPFLRDILKQLKWTFKGLRNTLAIIAQCTDTATVLIPVLFPLALVIGILAALNRVFLRSLRDFRKKRMQEYEIQHKELLQSTKFVHSLQKPPESYDAYTNSWLVLDGTVYYIDDHGKSLQLEKSESQHFLDTVEELKTKDIHGKMQFYLQYLQTNTGSNPISPLDLNFYSESYEALPADYEPDSYIYLSSTSIANDAERLFYKDANGIIKASPHSSAFHKRYCELSALVETRFSPSPQELHDFTTKLGISETTDATRYQQLELQRKKISKLDEKNTPKSWEGHSVFLSAAFSGLCDGLYYYMGTVTLAVFSPQIYGMLLVCSLLLVAACIIARIHEEHQYQVKYAATVLYTKLSFSKSLCLALSEVNSMDGDTYQVLARELATYKALQLERDTLAQGSMLSAIGTGLMNGLATQGVIAGFMSMVTSIWLGPSAILLPSFVIACVTIGMVILGYYLVDAIQRYNQHSLELKRYTDYHNTLNIEIQVAKDLNSSKTVEESRSDLHKSINYIRKEFDPILDPQPIEWAEILRLFIAGLKKGDKTSIELFYSLLKKQDELWIMPALLFVSSTLFGIILAGRFIAKNIVAPQPEEISVKEGILARNYDDLKKKTAIQINKDHQLHNRTYLEPHLIYPPPPEESQSPTHLGLAAGIIAG